RVIGPARVSVDGFAEFAWRDDVQAVTYLRRANLGFGVDLYERVGLQGTLGYAAGFSPGTQQVTSARLTLSEVALVVRPIDELYLGVVLDDVWDLTGGDPNRLVELRPEFTVVWNRCCWALYGSWDSATGVVAITLTTPGADQGLRQVFGTGLVLPPRRPWGAASPRSRPPSCCWRRAPAPASRGPRRSCSGARRRAGPRACCSSRTSPRPPRRASPASSSYPAGPG